MSKLNQKAVALAFGMTAALVYIICIVFVAVFPLETVAAVGNYFVHGIDISSIAEKSINIGKSIIGLVVVSISSAVAGYIFALFYNLIAKRQ
ncbi:hypothetical protein HYV80_06165 [Candidatus Woesearchaeota archaeon]|nr:hypothetical protein [Candidatus Woesearchaeota archaeon]